MKGIVYRFSALALACMVALSALVVPSFATDYQSTYNFWNWAYDNSWFLGKAIIGFSAGNVCQVSEDGLHHATTHSGGGGSVDGQRVYKCVCDLCGQEFQAVATDLEQSYSYNQSSDNYDTIDSNGNVYFSSNWVLTNETPDVADISYEQYSKNDTLYDSVKCTFKQKAYEKFRWSFYYTPDYDVEFTFGTTIRYTYDLSGNGYWYGEKLVVLYEVLDDGTWNELVNCADKDSDSTSYTLVKDHQYVLSWFNRTYNYNVGYTAYHGFTFPLLSMEAINANIPDYTRPSTFAPSFTYEDGDGWQVHLGLDGNKLIDETNLTYYNPVTNITTNIQSWSYDYSDRSYTILTDSNNTTTITYGDEYITINEADNITYNIYYYTAPDSSGDGDSSGSGGSGDDDGGGLLDKIGELIGSVLGGFIDVIGAALGKVIDSLIDLVTLTIDKLVNVLNLFGSFGDALGVLWSWLPEEVVTVLVSGVTVIVFASVIKLFMR